MIVHPTGSIPADEWTANVGKNCSLTQDAAEVRVIVGAAGVIDSYSRKEVLDLIKIRAPGSSERKAARVRAVMFTSSMLTRGVMQALSWMASTWLVSEKRIRPRHHRRGRAEGAVQVQRVTFSIGAEKLRRKALQ